MSLFRRIFEHLLPRARAWSLRAGKQLLQLVQGLADGIGPPARQFFDEIYGDLFPATTRQLDEWEQQFGLPTDAALSEAERRERLAGRWQALGGQSPRYLQDVLQAAGFDLYVHDWFEPVAAYSDPAVVRNPFSVVGTGTLPQTSAGEAEMECGEPFAECGNYTPKDGYPLINKTPVLDVVPIPPDPVTFRAWWYIGGPTFGDVATVPANRREDLEQLVLTIGPSHLWAGMIIEYV